MRQRIRVTTGAIILGIGFGVSVMACYWAVSGFLRHLGASLIIGLILAICVAVNELATE
jgi:hypothetical protein